MHELDKCEPEESSSGPYQCTLTKNDVFALKDLITKIILDDSIILETSHDNAALNIGHISPAQQFVRLVKNLISSCRSLANALLFLYIRPTNFWKVLYY